MKTRSLNVYAFLLSASDLIGGLSKHSDAVICAAELA